MKIVYSCQVPLGQGFALVAQHAVNALKEKGHEIRLFVPERRGNGIPGFDEWHDYYTALHMEEDFEIFIGWANASLESMKKAKRLGAKTVLHRGSAHIRFQEEVLMSEGYRFSADSVARQVEEYELADRIIVDSNFIRDTFRQYSPELLDKVHVVNLGVDTEKFKFEPVRTDKFVVLFVGGNTVRKGLRYLISAWLKLNLKNAQLRVIGTDSGVYPYRTDINYMRWVEDIADEYHRASVVCIPSLEDGWLMAATEAAACGRPVIISKNTGCIDILKDCESGRIVSVCDVDALVSCIQYFYNNHLAIMRMGRNARCAVEKCTWRNYRENFIKVIEK